MKLHVTIALDNEAFSPESGRQVAWILRRLAEKMDERDLLPGEELKLRDYNGNTVGIARVGSTRGKR